MRADRLVSILMLLEARKSITAKELAEQLEVAERTIYRDIDALCAAGVPILGASGRQGGYSLMEGYSIGLKGLNRDELLVLLSISIPEHFEHTEIGTRLKSSILKLRSTCSNLAGQENIQSRIYIDMSGWKTSNPACTQINALYTSIYKSKKVFITYSLPHYAISQAKKLVEPYGLVSKENQWYLVYLEQNRIDVLKLNDIIDVKETGESFEHTRSFNLKEFWVKWCLKLRDDNSKFRVWVQVHQYLSPSLLAYLEKGTVPLTPTPLKAEKMEWLEMELLFDTFEEARGKLLAFGGAIKVLEPSALRYSMMDYAEQVINLYRQESDRL